MRFWRNKSTNFFQGGFLLLLLVCVGQTSWWLWDMTHFTNQTHRDLLESYKREMKAAKLLLARGASARETTNLFPHLSIRGKEVAIDPGILSSLERKVASRHNRYLWEGSFFLLVLAAGSVILFRVIRQRSRLRRNQENFIAAVSHELKSPLASIRLSSETLVMRDHDREKRDRLVGRVLEEVTRLEGMITNILETRRVEEGRSGLLIQTIQLDEAIAAQLTEMGSSLADQGIPVETELTPGLKIQADIVAINTVIRNLVDNATKAVMGKEGGTIRLAAKTEGKMVCFEITDNGVGFPRENSERLFEKFFRMGQEIRRTSKGTGLGLYLVRRLVEQAGGRVSATSEGPGKGACFKVVWPRSPEDMT